MHIVLPPSETKRTGGNAVYDASQLAHAPALREAREAVQAALLTLSEDPEAAAKALKLGVNNRAELQHNLQLHSSGTLPAVERYTGVLYDALQVDQLSAQARSWLGSHVAIQSALFGLILADDPIPAYRLSASSRLPALARPLKRTWSEAHAQLDWASLGWVLDLRSKDYAALAPLPAGRGHWLHVAQRGEGGAVRALNHFNKAAKGDLVRRLAASGAAIDGPEQLLAWAAAAGLELLPGPSAGELTLVTELGAPNQASKR